MGFDLQRLVPMCGKLYLSVPQPQTKTLLSATTHSAGLAFDEPLPDVLAVPVTETQLQQLVNIWSDALSLTDLTHIRCFLANSFDKPSYADLMRTQTLASLIDATNGRWLAKVIDMGRLVTHLQPIVRSTAPDVVYGYECLLRGQDMDGQIIFRPFDSTRQPAEQVCSAASMRRRV